MIENNVTPILIVTGAVLAAAVALIAYLFWRTRRIESDYELLIRDSEGHNIVQIVSDNIDQVDRLLQEVDRLSEQYAQLLRRAAGAVQHVGVVRFDAFRDMGGMLSFAVALLDDRGNGLVFSSIYGRSESRTYAKPVVERSSSYELSPEEREAIRLAMQSKELGALPVEARDREHEERMANLRLFHDREYLQGSDRPDVKVDEVRRKSPPEERRTPSRPQEMDDEPREERPAPAPPRQVRVREGEGRPKPARRTTGRVRHVGAPQKKSQPAREAPAANGAPPEKSSRPVDLVAELEIDEQIDRTAGKKPSPVRKPGSAAARKPAARTAPAKPRGLDTPADRLRDRKPEKGTEGE